MFKILWNGLLNNKDLARMYINVINEDNGELEHLYKSTDEEIEEHIGDIVHFAIEYINKNN